MNSDVLKSASLKATKKRLMIIELIMASPYPVTADYIYEKLSETLDINLSTVYRALSAMTDKNILIKSIHMTVKHIISLMTISINMNLYVPYATSPLMSKTVHLMRFLKGFQKKPVLL